VTFKVGTVLQVKTCCCFHKVIISLALAAWRSGIASASEADDPSSNPASVKGYFRENVAMRFCKIWLKMFACVIKNRGIRFENILLTVHVYTYRANLHYVYVPSLGHPASIFLADFVKWSTVWITYVTSYWLPVLIVQVRCIKRNVKWNECPLAWADITLWHRDYST
jgi:hypothetical protein